MPFSRGGINGKYKIYDKFVDLAHYHIPGSGMYALASKCLIFYKSNFDIKRSMEAIDAATRVASETLHLENQIGTIEEGKLADLVVTAGNPLDDIGLLCNPENIHLVMQGGNLVKGSAA